jgi:protein arginine N-methyltransferase 5
LYIVITKHGIAGYFESNLYKNVKISILPETHTPDMFSWFPLYFPISSPIFAPAEGKLDVLLWRKTDHMKVWYEWAVFPSSNGTEIIAGASRIHNPSGRSFFIGL